MPVPVSSVVAHALRAYGRALPAKPLASTLSRVILARPSFLIAPSYKARGYATATKKAATATKAKTPAAKKPAARKTTAAAAAAKTKAKAKGKKTASATKKPASKAAKKPKKAAPKKAPKREVDPLKLERKKEREKVQLRRDLKRQALLNQEPTKAPVSAWGIYLTNVMRAQSFTKEEFGPKIKDAAAKFKTISADELQLLEDQARQNHVNNVAEYKKWVESHSPAETYAANNARRRLQVYFGVKVNPSRITDDRIPKAPSSPFAQYVKAHISTRDGKAIEIMKTLGSEWKTMSAADKKPYEDLWSAEHTRYFRELEKIKA